MRARLAVLSVWTVAVTLGNLGFLMIIYSVIAVNTAPWPPIEAKAPFISALATLVGTIVTAASVYLTPSGVRSAWQHSKFIISPTVILMCGFALYALFADGKLPSVMVTGFGLMAIAGGIIRILPYPKEDKSTE